MCCLPYEFYNLLVPLQDQADGSSAAFLATDHVVAGTLVATASVPINQLHLQTLTV